MNLRYGKFFSPLRKIVKAFFSSVYPLVVRVLPLPKVLSIEETLDYLYDNRASISRYGDGEFGYIVDKLSLPFQKFDPVLQNRLRDILRAEVPNHVVGLPIGYHSLHNLNSESLHIWRSQISWVYPRLRKYLDLKRTYFNASMTRPYADYTDKSAARGYFEKLMRLWEDRDVLLIEGEKSRLGVGNNLFSRTRSLKRVLGPKHHAFSRYGDMLDFASKWDKNALVLIAMGPTATVLSFDLARLGFQAIDIGNVDVEYEWYLRGVASKVKIPGKYTSEAMGGREVEDVQDSDYHAQIIARFL